MFITGNDPQSITIMEKMNSNNQPNNNQITQLETAIACSRRRLQTLWEAKGCTDAEVLNASIELDRLINEYLRLLSEE